MSDSIASYLDDHLAGARGAVDLLEVMRDRHEGEPLGRFAGELLQEIQEDRRLLRRLAERIGIQSNVLRETGAWLAEKTSRLKFRHGGSDEFGTFLALETLALGILGKRALWKALSELSTKDTRFQGPDYAHLIERAEAQHSRTERERIQRVRVALRAD